MEFLIALYDRVTGTQTLVSHDRSGAPAAGGKDIVVVEPTGSETQGFAKLGGEQVVAVFRERHQFNPGDMIRLKPDPSLVHLFDETTGKRLNA